MVRIEPFINREDVRAVLEGMLSHGEEVETSLEYLTLVDQFIDKRSIPRAENRRLFAVRTLISELITQQLTAHRRDFGLPEPTIDETFEQAHRSIELDVRQQSAELVGWSLLYYRYVRVDLNLTPGSLSVMSHIDERTLRRHQARTIEHLRDLLTQHEAQVRAREKHLHLLSTLPHGRPVGMVGRTELVEQVHQMLRSSPPPHLLLTGAVGIGKTSFVHLLLYQQIEADELDNIVWISEAESVAYVERLLHQTLLPEDSRLTLNDYFIDHRVAIVLDGIRELVKDVESLRKFAYAFTNAALYFVNTIHVSLTPDFKHILIPPLTRADIFAITTASRQAWTDQDDLADYAEHLWSIAGGNPMVARLAANSLSNVDLRQPIGIADELMRRLTEDIYQVLDRDTKQTLFILAFCPPFELEVDHLASIWPLGALAHDCIVGLVSGGLLQPASDGRYSLSDWVRRYIQQLYTFRPEVRDQIDRLIDDLTHCLMQGAESCFHISEYILSKNWPELSITRRLTWIELTCDLGIQYGNYAGWAAILEGQGKQNLPYTLRLKYAICLRKLGEWTAAEGIVASIVEETGHEGEFVWQGRGNLELSILLRQQGLYEKAYLAARRALAAFERFHQTELMHETELELAQIAFDSGDLSHANAILQRYSPDNIRALSLMGEICLAHGDSREAYRCVTGAISMCPPDSAVLGRLFALMGRIYFTDEHWAEAERYFSKAILLLETHSDQFALARVKTNLAAGLLGARRDYRDIRKLLTDAQHIQIAIRDRHGLMITQHNLDELDRHEAVDEW